MMRPTSKNPCKLPPATVIEGKWHGQKYILLKELGEGANGVVYLTRYGNQKAALKISNDGFTITSEVNVLKSFAKARGTALGPSLLDVDDWKSPEGLVSFYVMEFIEGPGFDEFIAGKGAEWVEVLFLQLLTDLDLLHQNGWVFGDLKPENLIIAGPPSRIRCVDVGGTTMAGRAIKEYTEFFDRGYWGMGSRKAEPSYDLFAASMVFISTAYPNRFNKSEGGMKQLQGAIRLKRQLVKYEPVLVKALKGDYLTAKEMREDFLKIGRGAQEGKGEKFNQIKPHTGTNPSQPLQSRQQIRAKTRMVSPNVHHKHGGGKETILIVSAMAILYIVYVVVQLI
ncbi:serine/threonine protein kinase [Bacillus sp. FJAT-27225]|uniref:protein kinase domain-containing protein n=1 Tax=Bacillus sp. FJAT-27225 TaxID=1743144 RepID=UPI00080C23D3|nr:serine/threonine-protein kinase [Bacillus sp. FJAT-27225]OCA80689.1 serine/threonine protein kinase [Bacillus sp. FJAT-27225]